VYLWLGIGLYLEKQKDGSCIRNMVFAFPVPVSGQKVKELFLENEATVEMVCLLVLRNPTAHINMDVDVDEMVQKRLFTESCWLPPRFREEPSDVRITP